MIFIFSILKFILFFLLAVLLLALFLIALILFFPFQYRVRADIVKTSFKTDIYISWLCRLIQYHTYDGTAVIKIFGIDINKMKKMRLFKKKRPKTDKKNEKTEDIETEFPEKNAEKDISENTPKEAEKKSEPNKISEEENQRESIFTKIQAIIERIKYFMDYPDREEIIHHSLVLVKKLYYKNKPKQLSVTGEIGFSAPDTTGKAIAAISTINSLLPFDITVKGNFEEEAVNFSIYVKGRLILWNILLPLVQYIFAKPIWIIVKKVFFKNKNERKEEVYV